MRDNTFAIDELLNAWEETYKKGQLTFWIFLALKESNKCVELSLRKHLNSQCRAKNKVYTEPYANFRIWLL